MNLTSFFGQNSKHLTTNKPSNPKTSLSNFSFLKFEPIKEKQTIVKFERGIHDADTVSQLESGHVFLVNLKGVLSQTFLSSFFFGF